MTLPLRNLLCLFSFCLWVTASHATTLPPDDDQTRGTLAGTVRTADGKPAEYVNIALKGTRYGTITDAQGRFVFKAPEGNYTLQTSVVGFQAQEHAVTVRPGETVQVAVTLVESTNQLQEVVVRDQWAGKYVVGDPSESLKLNARLIEVPQNITVTTRQTMIDWGILSTSELARTVSGVVKRYGDFNDFSFLMRGTDATNNVFRNGVGGYWWNQQEDAAMIERVEFVKGPAGFMIGNSEPGGLVNVVTKQPTAKRVRTVELGTGSWDMYRANVDLGGALTRNAKLTYRFVAGGQWQRSIVQFNRQYRTFVLPSLRYSFRPDSYVQLEYNRMDGYSLGGSGTTLPSIGGEFFRIRNSFAITDPNIRGLITYDNYVRLNASHRLANGWKVQGHVARVNGFFGGDGMYMTGFSPRQDTLYRSYYKNDWRNSLTSAQAFIDGTFLTGPRVEHKVLAGLDYGRSAVASGYTGLIDSTFTRLGISVANPQYGLPADSLRDLETFPATHWGQRWLALYVQDHIKINNRVVLTLAGRLNRTFAWNDEGQRVDSTSVRDFAFTPRLGLTYLFTDNFSAYALYDQTFLPQIGQKEDRTPAKPLTGTNLEAGLKGQFMNGRLTMNLSVYNTVKNNVLVQNPVTSFYIERGQVTSRGLDFDVVGNLTPALNVIVNYTYCDARVTQDANPDVVGTRNFGTPLHSGNLMLRYRFRAGWLNGFAVGAGGQYMGARSAVWADWNDPRDKNVQTPAYTLFDANVSYTTRRVTVTANAFNLTNRRYVDSGWYTSATETAPGYWGYTPGNPINVRLNCVFLLGSAH